MTLTPIAELLAVAPALPVYTALVCRGWDSNTQPSVFGAIALTQCATAALVYIHLVIFNWLQEDRGGLNGHLSIRDSTVTSCPKSPYLYISRSIKEYIKRNNGRVKLRYNSQYNSKQCSVYLYTSLYKILNPTTSCPFPILGPIPHFFQQQLAYIENISIIYHLFIRP